MPRVVQKIQTIILFIFLFNCASIIGLKTNTRLRLKTTTTQLQPSSEKNDELAGTLFDSLGSPDESTSDKLNDDSKEIEGAPSTGNKDPFVNTEPDTVNTVNDDELKKAAEEAETTPQYAESFPMRCFKYKPIKFAKTKALYNSSFERLNSLAYIIIGTETVIP